MVAGRAVALERFGTKEIGEVIAPAMAGILMHRAFVLGLPTDDDTVQRVVDHVILPAVLTPAAAHAQRNI